MSSADAGEQTSERQHVDPGQRDPTRPEDAARKSLNVERVLLQFPISHYCEKARWVLDYKRLPYRIHNQLPGSHAFTNLRLTGRTTVPLLIEDGRGISGSHAIALHLEACNPERRLLPASEPARSQLEALAREFDKSVAPAVRAFAYGLIITNTSLFRRLFFQDYRGANKWIGSLIAWPVSRAIARMYELRSPKMRQHPDTIRRAADSVERQLGAAQYLLEDRFSLADITVASLLGPIVGPPESPWSYDVEFPEFQAMRREFRARPIGDYISRLYRTHRS